MLRGELSTELAEAALAAGGTRALRRSGFCGMHTQARERGGMFDSWSRAVLNGLVSASQGDEELDLEAYDTLEFRMRVRTRRISSAWHAMF